MKETNADKRGQSEEMKQVFYTREEARLNIDVDIESLSPLYDGMDEEDLLFLKIQVLCRCWLPGQVSTSWRKCQMLSNLICIKAGF